MRLASSYLIAVMVIGHSFHGLQAAEALSPKELRVQRVGDTTYFHVRFDAPAGMRTARLEAGPYTVGERRKLSQLPRLVPQDDRSFAVYQRLEIPHYRPSVQFASNERSPVPIDGLEFVGKVRGNDKAEFLLLYPDGETSAVQSSGRETELLGKLLRRATWSEVPVRVDLNAAERVATPDSRTARKPDQAPTRDDLEGLWAESQAAQFAILEAQAPEFGFYGFACAATGRKYGVRDPVLEGDRNKDREKLHQRLYETTTGSAAITESLQLHRMLNPGYRDRGERTIDVTKLPGITIAEHPWRQMMGDKKPVPEPLAALTPHDNYYIHFKNVRKFIEFGELMDQWGTNITRAYEVTSRDFQLKERYERQLCIRSTALGKTLGPLVIRSLAVTGNDAYLREGSDLTVLFDVVNPTLFLAAVQPFLEEARRDFGRDLTESKQLYQGFSVESFVSPLREVSLHRATIANFVVYSNSLTALKRIIDTHQARVKSLAESLDFQYMRTVFRLDEKDEDGFAFLSDAFIRNLVSPASKIKEKRRLEALTSLSMITHAALFNAWETGKLPADHATVLASSHLKPEELYVPEGKGVTWDAARQCAVSDAYNTIRFATPLIELPMDKVTPQESEEYRKFREEYIQLWRRYFDPVGMRFAMNDKQVRMDTYILPLLNSSEYNSLRQFTGSGTASLDATRFSPRAVFQFIAHIAQDSWIANTGIGEWVMVRMDDASALRKLADYWVLRDFAGPKPDGLWNEELRVAAQLPLTAGIQLRDAKAFGNSGLRGMAGNFLGLQEDVKIPYKGVVITRMRYTQGSTLLDELNRNRKPDDNTIKPTISHAIIGDAWYVSLSEDSLRDMIDQDTARRDGKEPPQKEIVQINSSVYFAPEAAFKAGPILRSFLEYETHKRALPNNAIWYALYRCGLEKNNTASLNCLGFVPVSPDDEPYHYNGRYDEAVNNRHGSLRVPKLSTTVADRSPIDNLLMQLRTVRVDLRFREDGVHTVLTLDRMTATGK